MHVVIFEVVPADGQKDRYLDIAAEMRSLVAGIDGFISVERFESLTTPGKLLSLSFWRDEAAIEEWRALERHRRAQKMGRKVLFREYRLSVADVARQYSESERDQAPADSVALHG